MPQIVAEIGLDPGDLPDHSTLVKAFDRFEMKVWRVLLRLSAQLHDTADHAAMDATFFDRETVSKHYCRQTNYRVQTLKTTALVDTKTQAVLDVHCTTEKRHDTQIGWQRLRDKLREEDVRPLIKHREFREIVLTCAVYNIRRAVKQ